MNQFTLFAVAAFFFFFGFGARNDRSDDGFELWPIRGHRYLN